MKIDKLAAVANYVKENPGCVASQIRKGLNYADSTTYTLVLKLLKKGILVRETFGNKYKLYHKDYDGHIGLAETCDTPKPNNTPVIVEQSKPGKQLSDYTPRELMLELYKRGYHLKGEFVQVHTINFDEIFA